MKLNKVYQILKMAESGKISSRQAEELIYITIQYEMKLSQGLRDKL